MRREVPRGASEEKLHITKQKQTNKNPKLATSTKTRLTSVITATQKVEIRRMVVQGQPRQRVSKNLISTNKPGVVLHCYNLTSQGVYVGE
jgi:hypothetical protein